MTELDAEEGKITILRRGYEEGGEGQGQGTRPAGGRAVVRGRGEDSEHRGSLEEIVLNDVMEHNVILVDQRGNNESIQCIYNFWPNTIWTYIRPVHGALI